MISVCILNIQRYWNFKIFPNNLKPFSFIANYLRNFLLHFLQHVMVRFAPPSWGGRWWADGRSNPVCPMKFTSYSNSRITVKVSHRASFIPAFTGFLPNATFLFALLLLLILFTRYSKNNPSTTHFLQFIVWKEYSFAVLCFHNSILFKSSIISKITHPQPPLKRGSGGCARDPSASVVQGTELPSLSTERHLVFPLKASFALRSSDELLRTLSEKWQKGGRMTLCEITSCSNSR